MIGAIELGWQWRDPQWFLLLLCLPLLYWWRQRRASETALAAAALLRGPLAAAVSATPLPVSWRQRLAAVPALLELGALCLLVAALARPVQRLPLPPERLGRDVLLCFDRSSSMAAMDLVPGRTRFDVGLDVATAFTRSRPDDRLGFVEFARYADLRCPPTLDHDAMRELLGGMRMVEKDGPEDATGIGGAVAVAAEVLSRSSAKGKVVWLLTDGEENVATSATPDEIAPLHAAQLCAQLGIRVHAIVVGIGNQKPDGRFQPVDTTAVRQLATTTGGRFFTATDETALRAACAAIDALEVTAFAEPRVLVREWFALALGLGLVLAALGQLCGRTCLGVVP